MTITEMKTILANKLKDEGTYFKKSHISVKKVNDNEYVIIIKDYEHIPFEMVLDHDDIFGYSVYINLSDYDYIMTDDKNNYDIESALIELGYYIGTRF